MYSIQPKHTPKYMKKPVQQFSTGTFSTAASKRPLQDTIPRITNGVAQLPFTDQYKKFHKPHLSANDMKKVNNKTLIDQMAKDKFKDRESQNNFYVKYNFNPFMALRKKDNKREFEKEMKKRGNNQKIVDLADVLGVNEQLKIAVRPEETYIQEKMKKNTVEIIQKSKKNIQNLSRTVNFEEIFNSRSLSQKSKTPDFSKTQRNISSQINTSRRMINENKDQEKQKEKSKKKERNTTEGDKENNKNQIPDIQLDQIISWKQKNFFMDQNRKKINIFKLIQQDSDQISSTGRLQKYNFQFNSVIQKNYKFRIPIFRDLSTMGRSILSSGYYNGKEQVTDHLFNYQMTMNVNQVRYMDLMNIASNRISSQLLFKMVYADDRVQRNVGAGSDAGSEEDNKSQVTYRKGQEHAMGTFQCEDEQMQEIQTYLKLNFSESQKKYGNSIKESIDEMLKVGKVKTYLTSNSIRDVGVHDWLSEQMREIIRKILYPDSHGLKENQYEKIVRHRKFQSDRSNAIRISNLTDMMKQKHRLEMMEKQFGRFNDRSESNIR